MVGVCGWGLLNWNCVVIWGSVGQQIFISLGVEYSNDKFACHVKDYCKVLVSLIKVVTAEKRKPVEWHLVNKTGACKVYFKGLDRKVMTTNSRPVCVLF